jgi:hypothetical protein
MINFVWIVLIVIASSIITSALLVASLYTFYDSIHAFILRRKLSKEKRKPLEKDKSLFDDGGKDIPRTEKEVQIQDGQFRDYDRLREIAIGERTAKDTPNVARFINDESRDVKVNTIASGVTKPNTRTDDKEW